MNGIKRFITNKQGQALTEFVFIFPILLIVFLVMIQIAIVLNNSQRTQMSVWLGLRGVSLPKPTGYFLSWPSQKYSDEEVKAFIKKDFFLNKDDVDISYSKSLWMVLVEKCDIDIKSRVPYLFRTFRWDPIRKIFAGVVKDGKIESRSKGGMLKF